MNVLVIYGGRSGEHEISLISASAIVRGINKNHKVSLIGITKDGKWYLQDDSEYKRICDDKKATLTITTDEKNLVSIIPGANKNAFFANGQVIPTDVVFPALHGTYGEDGTIQGMLELIGKKYIGCHILSSSLCMDKVYTKVLFKACGIAQAKSMYLKQSRI